MWFEEATEMIEAVVHLSILRSEVRRFYKIVF